MTKYNHMLDVAFTVPNSDYADWDNIPAEEIIEALEKRVAYLAANPHELVEAIGHCDTYEE
jgi:hypothetical protein